MPLMTFAEVGRQSLKIQFLISDAASLLINGTANRQDLVLDLTSSFTS